MRIDLEKVYFKMSFRFNKRKPEDFGLTVAQEDINCYTDLMDSSLWQKNELYDFGWGNENGFIRLPKLTFDELWYLITNSEIQENKYGAAYIIEQEHPDELLQELLNVFVQQNKYISEGMKDAFNILRLHEPMNRSSIVGKHFSVIEKDFDNWKYVSESVKKLI